MDFIEGISTSHGCIIIMVVIGLSKYSHFVALSHCYTAKFFVQKFVEYV